MLVRSRGAVVLLAGLFLGVGASGKNVAAASETRPSDQPRTITLAYFADLHAQLEPHPELFWSRGKDELVKEAGGVARLATAIRALRNERPGKTLVMDAGDTIQGSAAAAWTEGAVVVPALNALELDLAIPGNWEVVYGKGALLKRAGEFHHPMIAANIRDATTGKLIFPPYLVKEVDGVRVGVIGFTDPDVPERQPPSYSKGLLFDKDEVIPPLVDRLRKEEHADVVVVLSHIGLPKAIALAERLHGVDIMLSGDTHERTYKPIVRGGVWIVEPGSFGSFFGRLDVTVAGGRVTARRWKLTELRSEEVAEAPDVKKIVAETLAPLRTRLDAVLGETDATLARYAVVETSLDAMLTDALREEAGVEIALSNGFRFASPSLVGPLREKDLWTWYPITGELMIGKATGKQLREFWERETENVFATDPRKLFGGWLPRTSGMTMRFESRAPRGGRVREILVAGEPIKDDHIYTIVSCQREGDPPDKLCRIPHIHDPKVLKVDAHAAVRHYLARHRPLSQPSMGRVVAVDLPPVVRSQVMSSRPSSVNK